MVYILRKAIHFIAHSRSHKGTEHSEVKKQKKDKEIYKHIGQIAIHAAALFSLLMFTGTTFSVM